MSHPMNFSYSCNSFLSVVSFLLVPNFRSFWVCLIRWKLKLLLYFSSMWHFFVHVGKTNIIEQTQSMVFFLRNPWYKLSLQNYEATLLHVYNLHLDTLGRAHSSCCNLEHQPDDRQSFFFNSDGEKRLSRAPGSSFSSGFGPLSIRRAQAIPGPRGALVDSGERNARETARKVPARLVVLTCRREGTVVVLIASSSHASSSARCKSLPSTDVQPRGEAS
jgi:hypothetical protein